MGKADKGSARNRLAGAAYEEEIVRDINRLELFVEVGRSSTLNKDLDRKKLDIIPVDADLFDEFIYRIQAKSTTKLVPYPKLLKDLKDNFDGIPVVFHKKTVRVAPERYLTEGRYAIMDEKDFLSIVADLERYKSGYDVLSQYWDSISDEEQPIAHKQLNKLGL